MKKGQTITADPRTHTLSVRVTLTERQLIKQAFGSGAAARDFLVAVAERMVKDENASVKQS